MDLFLVRRLRGASRRVVGHIDGDTVAGITGWAFARPDIERRVVVQVEVAAGILEGYRADLYRADVQRAGLGHSGYCGFFVPRHHLEDNRMPGRRFEHEVLPRVLVGDRPLAPPARQVSSAASRHDRRRATGLNGGLAFDVRAVRDGYRGVSRLVGWAALRGRPSERCLLRVETDRGNSGETRACLFRRDVDLPGCDGFCGFVLPVVSGARRVRLVEVEGGITIFEWESGRAFRSH